MGQRRRRKQRDICAIVHAHHKSWLQCLSPASKRLSHLPSLLQSRVKCHHVSLLPPCFTQSPATQTCSHARATCRSSSISVALHGSSSRGEWQLAGAAAAQALCLFNLNLLRQCVALQTSLQMSQACVPLRIQDMELCRMSSPAKTITLTATVTLVRLAWSTLQWLCTATTRHCQLPLLLRK